MLHTRRDALRHFTVGALAAAPVFLTDSLSANIVRMPIPPRPSMLPPRVMSTSSLHPKAVPQKTVTEHLHKHHKYAHHRRHPHHRAKSLRAVHTLNTPGNRRDLALTIWGEARGYGELGMTAVGCVIMNRVKVDHHATGHGIHGVCYKRKQFSCHNLGDPNRARMLKLPTMDDINPDWVAWVLADQIAAKLLVGAIKDMTAGATFYAAEGLVPYWRNDMKVVGVMFGHIFYKPKPHVRRKRHKHHTHH